MLPSFLFLAGGRPASRLAAGSDHCNILFMLHSDLDHADVDDACKYLSVGCEDENDERGSSLLQQ